MSSKIGTMKMTMFGGKELPFEMKGLEISTASSYEKGMVQGNQKLALAGVIIDGVTYGPGVIESEMSNLDGEALAAFQRDLYAV